MAFPIGWRNRLATVIFDHNRTASSIGDREGQIIRLEQVAFFQNHGALESVFQFADIARPVIVHKQTAGFFGKAMDGLPELLVVVAQEEFDERKDILFVLTKGRKVDRR